MTGIQAHIFAISTNINVEENFEFSTAPIYNEL